MAKKRTQDKYPIIDSKGKVFYAPVYQDDSNRVYTVDNNGNSYYVDSQNTFDHPVQLDTVNVYAPSPQQMLANQLSNYSTISNDRTQANNTLHRQYNTHLDDNAQRGAISHNTWTQEHPNLNAWGYVPTAAVLATAAYPFVAGVGSELAGTETGQAIQYGVRSLMDNPLVNVANTAAGIGFASKGLYDVMHGKFTPFTALDLAGFYPAIKGMNNIMNPKGFKVDFREMYYRNPTKEELRLAEEYPEYANLSDMRNLERKQLENDWFTPNRVAQLEQDEELRLAEREAARRLEAENQAAYEDMAERERNVNEEQRHIDSINVPDTDPSDLLPVLNTPNINAPEYYNDILANEVNIDNIPLTAVTGSVRDANEAPRIEDFANSDDYWDAVFAYDKANKNPITTRDLSKGERRYTREEVQDWLKEASDPLYNLSVGRLDNGRSIQLGYGQTGAHGAFYEGGGPSEALKRAIYPEKGELKSIRDANKFDNASGIFFSTHSGDTSVDSAPLLYAMMTKANAKGFVPILSKEKTVTTNSFGVRSYFPGNNHPMMKRAKKLFDSNPDAQCNYVLDKNGDAIGIKLEDADGEFIVPMRSADEVLERTNRNIRKFNEKYGTSYPEAVWQTKLNGSKIPYRVGNRMVLPSPFGIFYKQGGPINKRKLMTQL
jgi:hypothetical protein